jgi:hypothetical protein
MLKCIDIVDVTVGTVKNGVVDGVMWLLLGMVGGNEVAND